MDITFQHLRHPTCMQVLTSDVTRVFLARSRTRSLCSPLSLSSPLSCHLSLSLSSIIIFALPRSVSCLNTRQHAPYISRCVCSHRVLTLANALIVPASSSSHTRTHPVYTLVFLNNYKHTQTTTTHNHAHGTRTQCTRNASVLYQARSQIGHDAEAARRVQECKETQW